MAGRFLGPVQWRFRGDIPLCQSLMPRMRAMAGWLFNQIDTGPTGASHRVGKMNIDIGDGLAANCVVVAMAGPLARQALVDVVVGPSPSQKSLSNSGNAPPVVVVLSMQHGYEHVELLASESTIYLTDDLVDWYSGSGWSGEYFFGQLIAESLTFEPTWPDPPPTIVDGTHVGAYNSLDYLRNQEYPTHAYTGLARARIQAMLGCGIAADKQGYQPVGFSLVPGACGLVQDPTTKLYWACEIGSSGLRVQRMVSGQETAVLAEWVEDGTITSEGLSLARAYVYADLKPDPDRPSDVLLSPEEIASVYDNGNSWSVMAGWVWSPVAASASTVQIRDVNDGTLSEAFESSQHTVTITWSDGEPSASLSSGSWLRFRPYWPAHKFWFGNDVDVGLLRTTQTWTEIDDCAASAPVFCRYSSTGTLQVYKYYKRTTTTTTYPTDNMFYTQELPLHDTLGCGGVFDDSFSYIGTVVTGTGGYGWVLPDDVTEGESSWEQIKRIVGGSNGYISISGTSEDIRRNTWDFYAGACGASSYNSLKPVPSGDIDRISSGLRGYQSYATTRYDSYTSVSKSYIGISVYLSGSPDSVWYVAHNSISGGTHYYREATRDIITSMEILWYGRNKYTLVNSLIGTVDSTSAVYRSYSGWPEDKYLFYYQTGSTQNTENIATTYETKSTCDISDGTKYESNNWSAWSALNDNGTSIKTVALTAQCSAYGNKAYRIEPSGGVLFTGYIPSDAINEGSDITSWVGGI